MDTSLCKMPVPSLAWPRMVVSCQSLPPGPAIFFLFSGANYSLLEAPFIGRIGPAAPTSHR